MYKKKRFLTKCYILPQCSSTVRSTGTVRYGYRAALYHFILCSKLLFKVLRVLTEHAVPIVNYKKLAQNVAIQITIVIFPNIATASMNSVQETILNKMDNYAKMEMECVWTEIASYQIINAKCYGEMMQYLHLPV